MTRPGKVDPKKPVKTEPLRRLGGSTGSSQPKNPGVPGSPPPNQIRSMLGITDAALLARQAEEHEILENLASQDTDGPTAEYQLTEILESYSSSEWTFSLPLEEYDTVITALKSKLGLDSQKVLDFEIIVKGLKAEASEIEDNITRGLVADAQTGIDALRPRAGGAADILQKALQEKLDALNEVVVEDSDILQELHKVIGGQEGEIDGLAAFADPRVGAICYKGESWGTNRDAVLAKSGPAGVLLFVADGLDSEVASRLAVEAVETLYDRDPAAFQFEAAFAAGHEAIRAAVAQKKDKLNSQPQATVIGATVSPTGLARIAIGQQARAYLFTDRLITHRPSPAGNLLGSEDLIVEEIVVTSTVNEISLSMHLSAELWHDTREILNALQTEGYIDANGRFTPKLVAELAGDFNPQAQILVDKKIELLAALQAIPRDIQMAEGNLLVLCSKGLHEYLSQDNISRVLDANKNQSALEIARALKEAVYSAGAPDDVTVAVYKHEPVRSPEVEFEEARTRIREDVTRQGLPEPLQKDIMAAIEQNPVIKAKLIEGVRAKRSAEQLGAQVGQLQMRAGEEITRLAAQLADYEGAIGEKDAALAKFLGQTAESAAETLNTLANGGNWPPILSILDIVKYVSRHRTAEPKQFADLAPGLEDIVLDSFTNNKEEA